MATLVQSPNNFEMAYGPNIYTLTGIGTDIKFVLQLWDGPPAVGASALLATLKQSPNSNDRAIFDVQNVLQSYVAVGGPDIDELGKVAGIVTFDPLADSDLESVKYYVRFGTEDNAGTITWDGSSGPFYAFNGKKPFYERLWDEDDHYTPQISGDSEGLYNCTQVVEVQLPMSDWSEAFSDYITKSEAATKFGGVPADFTTDQKIDWEYVTPHDYRTKAWINQNRTTNPAPETEAKGIEGFRYVVYDGNTVLQNLLIPNIQANGGGPNADPFDGTSSDVPYKAITALSGPRNLGNVNYYTDSTTTANFQLDSDWTHYYMYPVAYTLAACGPNTFSQYTDEPIGRPQLYVRKDAECLDYLSDEYGDGRDLIQFSWLNSLGFRDYFTFRKRNERRIITTRNTYTASVYDPDAADWSTDMANRGDKVYSQEHVEEWTATTDFLTDKQAKYLEFLFTSPDVRVKLPESWYHPSESVVNIERFLGAVVTSNTYTERTFRKDRLFQYEITFRLANNIKSQRG